MGLIEVPSRRTWDYPWVPENRPLLYIDRMRRSPITFKRLHENVGMFGGTGSGKTTSGASIIMGALAGGASLFASAPKHNSAALVQMWARAVGREQDVRLIGPGVRFNFNNWLLTRKRDRMAVVREAVDMVRELTTLANRGTMTKIGADHPFFSTQADRLNSASVTVDLYANNSLSVERVLKIMQTISASLDAARSGSSFCREMCEKALKNAPDEALPEVRKAVDLLMDELPGYDGRLRGDCLASAMVLWSALDRYPLSSMFTGESDLTPEDLLKGGIFVLNMALSDGNEGLIAVGIWKLCLQKALMDRCGLTDQRPCIIMLEEGQEYVTAPSDYRFVAVCREASACFYYSSQSVATAIALIGEEAFNALVACLNTQIFCQNPCMVTNDYASRAFGQYQKQKISVSGGANEPFIPRFPVPKQFQHPNLGPRYVTKPQVSASLEWEPCYRPEVFLRLQRGGGKDALVETRVRMMAEDNQTAFAYECFFNQNLYKEPFKKPGFWCRGRDIVTLAERTK